MYVHTTYIYIVLCIWAGCAAIHMRTRHLWHFCCVVGFCWCSLLRCHFIFAHFTFLGLSLFCVLPLEFRLKYKRRQKAKRADSDSFTLLQLAVRILVIRTKQNGKFCQQKNSLRLEWWIWGMVSQKTERKVGAYTSIYRIVKVKSSE